jgi:hypothetical protein
MDVSFYFTSSDADFSYLGGKHNTYGLKLNDIVQGKFGLMHVSSVVLAGAWEFVCLYLV